MTGEENYREKREFFFFSLTFYRRFTFVLFLFLMLFYGDEEDEGRESCRRSLQMRKQTREYYFKLTSRMWTIYYGATASIDKQL